MYAYTDYQPRWKVALYSDKNSRPPYTHMFTHHIYKQNLSRPILNVYLFDTLYIYLFVYILVFMIDFVNINHAYILCFIFLLSLSLKL